VFNITHLIIVYYTIIAKLLLKIEQIIAVTVCHLLQVNHSLKKPLLTMFEVCWLIGKICEYTMFIICENNLITFNVILTIINAISKNLPSSDIKWLLIMMYIDHPLKFFQSFSKWIGSFFNMSRSYRYLKNRYLEQGVKTKRKFTYFAY
jgi:hypothetical protein